MNKYEELETIGEGEYGLVKKARNKDNSELVAIKKFKEDDSDEEYKRVILREVKILKTLNHENIISLKEAFRKKGKIYLVCEYVEKNLLEVLEERANNPNSVRNYTYQLLKGLQYMHSLNVIHRDIKPENVLISKLNQLKICDLGFARMMPTNGVMTDYVATRWYRPPELLIGKENYDKSIDIWSAGCVMAEMVDGEPLFGGENDLDQLYLIQKCLGPLTAQHQEDFLKNPKFIGMKFPDIHTTDSIDRKYFGKIDKMGLDLLKKMLKMDPNNRITAEEALKHPYFQRTSVSNSSNDLELKKYSELHSDADAGNNFSQVAGEPQLILNNFLQNDKDSKDKRLLLTKAKGLGLSKLRKNQDSLVTSKETFTKGKSLGKTKNPSTIREDKFERIMQLPIPRASKEKQQEQPNKHQDGEDYYEEKWEEEEEHRLHEKQQEEHLKREELRGKQNHSKTRRDNFNIVFNSNTYNLNLIDPYH